MLRRPILKFGMTALIFGAVLFGFRVPPCGAQVAALIRHGDAEEKQGRTKAALADFEAAEQLEPKNPAILLRLAKQHSDLVDATKARATAEQHARKSLDYSQRALTLDPKIAKAHLSLAVAYGKLTDFVGNKTKLEYSKIIKDETVKSLDLDPTDDFAWYVLGRWHAGVANVNGVLRTLATVVYGGMPPASNGEAAKCLKKATELAPQRIMHRAELARLYKIMGQADLAAKEWQAIVALTAADPDEEKEKVAAREALGLPAIGARE